MNDPFTKLFRKHFLAKITVIAYVFVYTFLCRSFLPYYIRIIFKKWQMWKTIKKFSNKSFLRLSFTYYGTIHKFSYLSISNVSFSTRIDPLFRFGSCINFSSLVWLHIKKKYFLPRIIGSIHA